MEHNATPALLASPRIEANLHEVVFESPDVAALSAFYEDALGYVGQIEGGVWQGTLASRALSIREGAANEVADAVLAVPDEGELAALGERLAEAGIPFEKTEEFRFDGSALRFRDPDGHSMSFGVLTEGIPEAARPEGTLSARLQHVVYASDQVGKMLRFYTEVVGFVASDVVYDERGDITSVFLRCGEEHHSLAVFRAPRCRIDHICYEVESWDGIRDWADHFAERRIPIQWGPGRHGPGNNLFLFVVDPDGNWVEFSAELERVTEPRPLKRWVHEERTLNSWGPAFLRS